MSGFSSNSSRLLAALGLVLGASCVDHEGGRTGTTSLRVEVTSPANLGSAEHRLADGTQQIHLKITALDEQGNVDTSFNEPVDVYPQFLGSLTEPKRTFLLEEGVGTAGIMLPETFGPTYLWVEDASEEGGRFPTYATGTSPVLWYREPFLRDVSEPDLSNMMTWLSDSPLEGKQVRVGGSRHGTDGKLVITGVYAQGFTVSDANCQHKPCVADPFDHIFVFSFGRPRDAEGRPAQVGQVVDWMSGGVGEFNGFTELNFPQFQLVSDATDETLVPEPIVVEKAWLGSTASPTGPINLEKVESGLIAVVDGTVCPLDADFTKYAQWKIDVGNGCGKAMNVITAGQVPGIDPPSLVGTKIKKLVGTLKAVNIGNFNVWILLPRRQSDLTL